MNRKKNERGNLKKLINELLNEPVNKFKEKIKEEVKKIIKTQEKTIQTCQKHNQNLETQKEITEQEKEVLETEIESRNKVIKTALGIKPETDLLEEEGWENKLIEKVRLAAALEAQNKLMANSLKRIGMGNAQIEKMLKNQIQVHPKGK